MIVRPENEAVTSVSTWNTRLVLLALMLSRFAPGLSMVIAALVLLSSSCPCFRVIIAGVLGSWKMIALANEAAFAGR